MPLAELLDTLDMTTPNKVRDTVIVKHPLQPFDTRNVIPGKLIPGEPFSFDPTVLNAAQARSRRARGATAFHLRPPACSRCPTTSCSPTSPAFFRDPVKGFFRALDYTLPWEVDGVEDAMPVDIDALEEWTVGDRMLHDMLHGMEPDQARQAEWRRGTLPPGRLGWRKATEIRDQAVLLADAARLAAETRCRRRRHRPRRRATADRHRLTRLRGAAGVGDVLEAGRASPAAVVDSVAGVDRSRSRRDWSAICIGRAQARAPP